MRRLRSLLADSGPVLVLAGIAAVGSFDHISHLAAKHGQSSWRSWAVAVCIDLMCVMAAREIQRDKRTRRTRRGPISWPSLVLTGGIVLTLAANLAEAEPNPWGWILAATPAGAFLIAMSMLERRAGDHAGPPAVVDAELVTEQTADSGAVTTASQHVPSLAADTAPAQLDPVPTVPDLPAVDAALLEDARFLAGEHARLHDTAITADDLVRRLRISPDLAAEVLRRLLASQSA
ncbi:DUF2637 domain-containing protein [Sphaerisporangium perillae]|uniref:DUF2637 domain-containing protein n=1 Tax=Sphaerisporangium perillae TaxID=2935860 RepID=UPI00200E64CF|nr:DUF2637 domain-containing protein [Sphaerisporangium perillae]